MAKDLKEIFAMDTSTLEELRLKISELKKALNEYTIGSKEYVEANTELQNEQKRLKAAMSGVKTEIDKGAESFNTLNIQLGRLKEAWKAATDEAKRGELTAQINDVKARINGMNESIGNFQHNVGNYSNSIIDAFQKMGISVTSLTAPLKKVGVDIEGVDTSVKLLIGTFKTFSGQNLAALKEGFSGLSSSVGGFIKSLTGVKAAVAATGLGVLLVLIGELIAHWDDLTGAIDRWVTASNKGVTTAQQLEEAYEAFNYQLELNARLMQAAGASEEEVIQAQIESIKQKYAETEAIAYQNTMLAANAKWIWTRTAALKGEKEAIEQMKKLNEDLKKLEDDLLVAEVKAEAAKKNTITTIKKQTQATKELAEAEEDVLEAIEKADQAEMEAETEALKKKYEEAQQLAQAEAEKRKTDLELEEEAYKEKLELFKQFKLDTEALELNHLERMEELRKEQAIREEEEFQKHKDNMDEDDKKSEKKYENLMQARVDATMNMAKGTTTILKNISSAMGENTKLAKGFAIAAATIDTIASAVAGFRAGWNQWEGAGFMAWMAPVQAALNATMALTAGFAEVQKIRNVDTSGNASGGGSTALAMAIPNIEGLSSPVDYTRQVTTETEKEEMNQGNRVYILESDIQQSNNRVRVREEETTF